MEALRLNMGGAACLGLQATAHVTGEPEQGNEDNFGRGQRRSLSARPAACCYGAAPLAWGAGV